MLEELNNLFKPFLNDEYCHFEELTHIKWIKDNTYEVGWIAFVKDSDYTPYHYYGGRFDLTHLKREIKINKLLNSNFLVLEDILSISPEKNLETMREEKGLKCGMERLYELRENYKKNS